MDFGSVVLSLGPAIATCLYKVWRKRKGKTDSNSTSLQQLIAQDCEDKLAIRKIEREIGWLAENIVESLQPVFDLDGGDLKSQEIEAVATALKDTFSKCDLTPAILIEGKLDPLDISLKYKQMSLDISKDLSEKEKGFYDISLMEMTKRLVSIADQLPGFASSFYRNILEKQGEIVDNGRKTLDEIIRFTEENKKQDSYIMNNFSSIYKSSVLNAFGDVYILGLEHLESGRKIDLNISYLSLRVECKDENRRNGKKEDVKSDEILSMSKRIILKGDAGSGKTTLLQWIAINSVQNNFIGKISNLNNYFPIFIRLRNYYNKKLPNGKNLFQTTSEALSSIVDENWMKDIFFRGRALFLIDGLDEISEQQRSDAEKWLKELVTVTPDSYFIVTSRPSAVKENYLSSIEFDEYFLKPMNRSEIINFIDYWHEGLANTFDEKGEEVEKKEAKLTHLIENDHSIVKIASTPLLCAVICTLNFDGRMEVISGRVDLYNVASRLLMHDRGIRKGLYETAYSKLGLVQKERIFGEIAYWLTKNGQTTCTLSDIRGRLKFLSFDDGSENDRTDAELPSDLVLRAGLLKEVSPDNIQFVHKTFQEYFSALAVTWHDDQIHLTSSFDLRNWNELFLISVEKASCDMANRMLKRILQRFHKERETHFILLAAAGAESIFGVEDQIRKEISEEIKDLIPPKDYAMSHQLSLAGSLVIPFLEFSCQYSEEEICNIIDMLGYMDSDESRRLLKSYVSKSDIGLKIINAIMVALDYSTDKKFCDKLLLLLKKRDMLYFYRKEHSGNIIYISSDKMLRHIDSVGGFKTVILDGREISDIDEALVNKSLASNNTKRLVMKDCYRFSNGSLRCLQRLQDIIFFGSSLDDFSFLSSLEEVNTIRFINGDIGDWDTLRYGSNVRDIYICYTDINDLFNYYADCLSKGCRIHLDDRALDQFEQMKKLGDMPNLDHVAIARWADDELIGFLENLVGPQEQFWYEMRHWRPEDQDAY